MKEALRQRDDRLDAVKGVAIVAVVFGHAARGMISAGLAPVGGVVWQATERVVYFMHLPLFVITTGLLLAQSVGRVQVRPYLARRIPLLVWPFLIWTAIQGAAEVGLGRLRNSSTSWLDVVKLWIPIGHLWYLPFLLLALLIVVPLRPWESARRAGLSCGLALVVSLLAWGHDGQTVATRGMSLLIFLTLGAALGLARLTRFWNWLGLTTDALQPTANEPFGPPGSRTLLGFVVCLLAVIGIGCLVAGLVGLLGRRLSWLASLGRYSLQIYLAHILVTAGVRIGLVGFGVDDQLVHIVLGTVLGTALPLVLVWAARFVPWLFTPPPALLAGAARLAPATS